MVDPDVYADRAQRGDSYEEDRRSWYKGAMWFKDENWGEYRHKDQVAPMGIYLNPVTGSKYKGAPIAHPLGRFGVYHYVVAGSGGNAYTVVASYPPGINSGTSLDGPGWAWEERNHPNVRNHPTLGDVGLRQDRSRYVQGVSLPTTVRQTAHFADGTFEPIVGDFDLSQPSRKPQTFLPYEPEWFDPIDEPHLDPNKGSA